MAHQLRNRLRAAWAGLPLRSKGLVVIAIPLGALLVGLVCFFLLGQAEDRQEKWVDHTLRVRSELHLVLIHLVDAETGMRGYLLSRREEFLEPYHAGRKALPESLSRVSDLIQDDPQQIARLRAVKLLVTERLEKLASVMETAAAGSDLPSARTTAGLLEGKAIMDALRQKLARMDQEEGHFMDERVAALDRVRNWSFAAFVASGLFGVLGGVAAMLILSKGVVIRTRALEENTRRLSEEKALRASEAFSRSVIESSPDCIKVLDLEGNLLSMEAGMELLGITDLAPLLGKPWNEFWEGAEDRAAVHAAVATAAAGGEGHFVGFFRTLRGEDKWWDVVISPILDANGKPARLLAVSRDVTQRQQAEEVLRQRTAQFETLLNEAPVGIYLIDADFRVRQVNSAGRPAFGDISDLIGRDFAEVMHILWPQAEADQTIKQFRHALETGEPCFVPEMIAKRADRQTTEYYEWQINRIPLPDGRHGVVCYFRDISDRVLAQLEIRASEARYRSLFNSIDEGFCIIEMIFDKHDKAIDYRFLEVNPAFEPQTGIHDATGKRMREIAPDHDEHWFEAFGKVALTGEAVRFVSDATALGGRWFDVYAFRLSGPESSRVALLFSNITERKHSEQALRESNEELTAFNRVAVGRELRMIELKQEINGLCALARQPPRYAPAIEERQS